MTRLKINIPQNLLASFVIPVRITDINYGNHVGNNAMVEIIHEARVQFLNKYGWTEFDTSGVSLIMSELSIEYKKEAFYKDELTVKVFSGEISAIGFDLFYSISAIRDGTIITIAHAKTGMICYNYQTKKVERIPEKLKSSLST